MDDCSSNMLDILEERVAHAATHTGVPDPITRWRGVLIRNRYSINR